jgi:hypothetical protein
MKKVLVLVLVSLTLQGYSQTEKTYSSKKEKKKFYDELSNKYAHEDVKYIWSKDTEQNFTTWVDGDKESELIDDWETVVHETFHGLCNSLNDGQNYFISKDLIIFVPYSKVYNSKELNTVVRKGQQDSIYRYGIYVKGENHVPKGAGGQSTNKINTNSRNEASSIQDGIYGMTEEFAAYYFSTLASFHTYDHFVSTFGKEDVDASYDYRHMVEGTVIAYYEFHFFIAKYLMYAKEKEPEVYKGIMNNKAFRVVFTLIENRFINLILDYNDKLEDIPHNSANDLVEQMDFSGSDEDLAIFAEMAGIPSDQIYKKQTFYEGTEVYTTKTIILSQEYLDALKPEYDKFIPDVKKQMEGDIFFYYASPTKQYNYLNKQVTSEMKAELAKLMFENCTDANYKDFLK